MQAPRRGVVNDLVSDVAELAVGVLADSAQDLERRPFADLEVGHDDADGRGDLPGRAQRRGEVCGVLRVPATRTVERSTSMEARVSRRRRAGWNGVA